MWSLCIYNHAGSSNHWCSDDFCSMYHVKLLFWFYLLLILISYSLIIYWPIRFFSFHHSFSTNFIKTHFPAISSIRTSNSVRLCLAGDLNAARVATLRRLGAQATAQATASNWPGTRQAQPHLESWWGPRIKYIGTSSIPYTPFLILLPIPAQTRLSPLPRQST